MQVRVRGKYLELHAVVADLLLDESVAIENLEHDLPPTAEQEEDNAEVEETGQVGGQAGRTFRIPSVKSIATRVYNSMTTANVLSSVLAVKVLAAMII